MTRHITLHAACAVLLAASAATLNAQDDSLALPKNNGAPNFTIEFGPSYSHNTSEATALGYTAKSSGDGWGAGVAFGWRIDRHNKLSASIGAGFASEDSDGITEEDTGTSFGIAYDYYIPIAAQDRCELHIGAGVGFGYQYTELKSGGYTVSDSAVAPFYGIRAGLTVHLNRKCYLDFTYGYSRTGDYKMNFDGLEIKAKVTAGNTFNASVGFKF
jgi:hypothetical protein